jgi:spore maturation protein CgeB
MLRSAVKSIAQRSPSLARLASELRARQQEQLAHDARRSLLSRAKRNGILPLGEAETIAALRLRLAARATRQGWPKRKGELHLFVAFRLFNWEEVLSHAFLPFGQVTVFEWGELGLEQNLAEFPEQRSQMNKAMRAAFDAAHAKKPIDGVIGYLSGANTEPKTLAHMAAQGAAVFNFSYDDKLDVATLPDGSPRGPAGLAKVVDLNLSSDPDAAVKYALHGGLVRFHPECADPNMHRPYDVPFTHDVTFVGARYGFRPFFIEKLRALGISVEAFGRGWQGGSLSSEDMVKMYSRSRINLGFGGIGHSRKLMCLKGRDFEVALSGGLYLTQYNPELALVFDTNREIVTYTDEADCVRKIHALLANPARANAIRVAGRERCLRDHTYEARWTAVLKVAGIL